MTLNDTANSGMVSIDSLTPETIIGLNTRFKGNVKTDKPVRIDGVFEGSIVSDTLVIISESGSFSGEVSCAELRVDGKAQGKAICTSLIRIADIGSFEGEVTTRNIIMTEGSLLEGTVTMKAFR